MAEVEADVVVVGAGVAGLAAARRLAEAGRRVVVVEARDRIGGRILTVNAGPDAAELGAEFVHGKPAELWSLLDEAGLGTVELGGSQFCWTGQGLQPCGPQNEADFRWLEDLTEWTGEDRSFAEYLEGLSVGEQTKAHLIEYVEGFNAADHTVVGVAWLGKQQRAEDAIEGDRLFHVRGGYSQVPEFLARAFIRAGGKVVLGAQVTSVQWERGAVRIGTEREGRTSEMRASKAIVTLPLGVLQARVVQFDPTPTRVLEAADRLRMGLVRRIVLQFREAFWRDGPAALAGELQELSFLHAPGRIPAVWWTPFPEERPWLTAWTGGPRAVGLATSRAHIEDHLLSELGQLFGRDAAFLRDRLVGVLEHDWQNDPYARGAYSYGAPGGVEDSTSMAAPVEQTLYFAGEHTDITGHGGTVHGALRSGLRAAEQVLQP